MPPEPLPRSDETLLPATDGELARDAAWQRLDPRMLLVHPVQELVRFLPVVAGVFIAGNAASDGWWHFAGLAIPVVTGLLRYATTTFRVYGGRVELRHGLISRHTLSTPIDRVRTVDLTASPVHRLLGLSKVRVGTGTASTAGEDRLDLDSLPTARAQRLRGELLRVASGRAEEADAADSGSEPGFAEPAPVRRVLDFDPRWLRFAPLTSSGLVIASGLAAAASQVLNLGGGLRIEGAALPDAVTDAPLWLTLIAVLVFLATSSAVLAVAGYAVTNWGWTLTHDANGGTWHLRRGLLTTRETSIDEDRLRGVERWEPLGLRLAGAGRLAAIVTGLDRASRSGAALVPPAPRAVVDRVAGEVLGTSEPIVVQLTSHGPRARTRRFTRALLPVGLLTVLVAAAVLLADGPLWPVVAVAATALPATALAADRARALGHALTDGWLVLRSGSLLRRREVLATDGVIGWTFRATWWQRRAGLLTLEATTAGGRQAYAALDIPEVLGVRVAQDAVPGLVEQFVTLRK